MLFNSLGGKTAPADFREATIQGQAPDGGLYFPEKLPALDAAFLKDLKKHSREEIAFRVIQPFVGNTIPENDLHEIVSDTIAFPIPLVKVDESIESLELFHGPTLAFKDIGARFMSRCLGYFARGEKRKITVLVATSGDTGGAVASGFHHVEGVDVVILYPSGKVSPVQEKQLTTLGGNITALEVEGNFDDCQRMVKQAFRDEALRKHRFLTSANSINVARWLPQQFYYFFALQQWNAATPPVIAVPSGNFGNLCAGIMAWKAGLPVSHFIAACNINDVVPRFLQDGKYVPEAARATISNAMDVGDPSNFVRILEIFRENPDGLHQMLSAVSITDDETRATIREVYRDLNYRLDPHGAVGYTALHRWLGDHAGESGLFLETAHPIKFPEVVEAETGEKIPIPGALLHLLDREKSATLIPNRYEVLRDLLFN
ncbi:threonine synthase [Flavihumibacter petaseus]|uniref:Threonine synthase n=1 Tax=Flavihumibacter petaseus NBRC 106054 TaxID=1220578 RepID=A0A0E9MTQ8_9BACT|nr:threonine synthase [Flavihumibacter petaseus]GAO41157.1 threonine synthase [Flavihumibacter petaseus NBRC 106054]